MDLAFDCLDVDKSGDLSVEEIRCALGREVSSERMEAMVKEFDKNSDGVVRHRFNRI